MDSSSTDAHAARVAEVFRKHDRDASGTMDAGELEAALAELGALPKAGDAKLFVAGLMARCEDVDGDRSSLTITEFHSLFDLGRVRRAFRLPRVARTAPPRTGAPLPQRTGGE